MTASSLFYNLRLGNWRAVATALRAWYAENCHRWTKDEVELRIASKVETWLWDQRDLAERVAKQGQTAPLFGWAAGFGPMTQEEADAFFIKKIGCFLDDEPKVYARFCSRIDSTPPAEEKIAETVKRLEKREVGK